MDKRQKKLVSYLVRKYQKTFLTKKEALVELYYEIERNKISIDEVARRICEEYKAGIIF
jgi:hypothetical protein